MSPGSPWRTAVLVEWYHILALLPLINDDTSLHSATIAHKSCRVLCWYFADCNTNVTATRGLVVHDSPVCFDGLPTDSGEHRPSYKRAAELSTQRLKEQTEVGSQDL